MEQLPVSLYLKGRKVVVTGAGTSAARKAERALQAGARVLVIAPEIGAEFDALDREPNLSFRVGEPEPDDFTDAAVAFLAMEDAEKDRSQRAMAKAKGALVNVPDRPELCDFSMPSIVDRSPLSIAIASAGASPLLTRLIKERLETTIPASFGELAQFLRSIRAEVEHRIPDKEKRRHFLETLLEGTIADMVLAGEEARARELLGQQLSALDPDKPAMGEVYLVGGGPGDPDLLTFRALRLMQRADVVVFDRLIGSPLLDLVRRDAERIYVGKRRAEHTMAQEDISKLLVALAREGKRVLRLKGGDPFIFGRGGEEIELLAAEGIPFQVVPGVTAAAGCASYAGIPLTHRDHAQACVFVTGHTKTGRVSLDWKHLVQPNQTVVIYMGLAVLAETMHDFRSHGADPGLPVAVVENGTKANQRVVIGTVDDIAEKSRAAGLRGPALIIIGTVVSLHEKLAWYRTQAPLTAPASARFGAGEAGPIAPQPANMADATTRAGE